MVEIKEVKTKRELKKFIMFPFKLYKNNPYWVPPLISDEIKTLRWDINPAFDFCKVKYWMAYKNGKPVGRIAGIINDIYIKKWKNKYARFGWIDFIDDKEVSKALIDTVENWAKSNGMVGVHGPLGFTDFDPEGMLVQGFNELSTVPDIYNYPYYPKHIEALGYKKDADWVEYEVKVPDKIPEKALRIADIVVNKYNLNTVKAKKPKELLKYAHGVFDLIDVTYQNLYSFVPLPEKQVEFYIKQYFPHIVPDYVKIILNDKDEVVGFVIGLPSLSKALQKAKGRLFPFGFIHLLRALKHNEHLDLYLGAVRKDYQVRGVDALMMVELTKTSIKNGIKLVETNNELENNLLVRAHWKYFESRQHKRRRCYINIFE